MTDTVARPLVSFVLLTYRQQDYVAEAVRAALAQTYQPLEILISDDCSADATFKVIQDIVADYRGPHRVVINRNDRNLGIGNHVNKVMELSSGELVVVAAGDDVSEPERVTKIAEVWLGSGKRAKLLHSAALRIDNHGEASRVMRPVPEARGGASLLKLAEQNVNVIGATAAWSREIFERFGPLPGGIGCEDAALLFRARMLGSVAYIDDPLVRYRDGGISSDFGWVKGEEVLFGSRVKYARWWRDAYRCRLADLKSFYDPPPMDLVAVCERELARWRTLVDLAETRYLVRLAKIAKLLLDKRLELRWRVMEAIRYGLPAPYKAVFNFRARRLAAGTSH